MHFNLLNKIQTLLLGLIVLMIGPNLLASPQLHAAPKINWNEVDHFFSEINQKRFERIQIEKRAYEITSDLCYAFEFRNKHKLDLESPNPLLEAWHMELDWYHDQKLQRAYWQWTQMDAIAFESIVGDDTSFISSRSQFSKILLDSVGFDKASSDCTLKMGFDISHAKQIKDSLRFEIIRNERLKSGSATLLIWGGVFRGTYFLWTKALKSSPLLEQAVLKFQNRIKILAPQIKRNLTFGLIGASLTIPPFLVVHQYLAVDEENKTALRLVTDADSENSAWEEWTIRRALMHKLFSELNELQVQSEKLGRLDCLQTDLCEKVETTLQLFSKDESELVELMKKTEIELMTEASRRHIANPEGWLVEILAHPESVDPQILERIQFVVAARVVTKLLKIRKT